jgi:hypothetical protein
MPHPARINHHHRHSGSIQRTDHDAFIAPGRFDHHPPADQRLEPLDHTAHRRFIVGLGKTLAAWPHCHIQPRLRHIHAHLNCLTAHLPLPACRSNSTLRNATWLAAGSCDCSNLRSASSQARRFLLSYDLTWSRGTRSAAPGSILGVFFQDT